MSVFQAYSFIVSSFGKSFMLWVIVLLLFGGLMIDGLGQLQVDRCMTVNLWNYACPVILFTGSTKVIAASGLLIPRLRQLAVLFVVSLALLNVYLHFLHHDVIGFLIDVMNIGLAAMVYWYSSSRFQIS